MTYIELIQSIKELKREEYGIYNSQIEREIALDRIEAVNDTIDEVLELIRALSMQNIYIHN